MARHLQTRPPVVIGCLIALVAMLPIAASAKCPKLIDVTLAVPQCIEKDVPAPAEGVWMSPETAGLIAEKVDDLTVSNAQLKTALEAKPVDVNASSSSKVGWYVAGAVVIFVTGIVVGYELRKTP